jgi:hypothetical protein
MAALDDARKAGYPGLHLIGCSYRGIGIGDCVKSGFEAAQEIAAFCGTGEAEAKPRKGAGKARRVHR